MEEPLREMPFKTGVSSDGRPMHYSVGALIEDHGAYLLFDRTNFPFGYAGMAGHVDKTDPNELEALLREGREELGVELTDVVLRYEEEVPWNKCRSCDVHYWYLYRAKVVPTEVKIDPGEAKNPRWLIPAQLREMQQQGKLEKVWEHWLMREGII